MRELFERLDYLNRQRPIAQHNTSACPPITGDKCEGAELKPRAPLSPWHSRSKMRMRETSRKRAPGSSQHMLLSVARSQASCQVIQCRLCDWSS
jgi:hypothetical protein